MKIGAAVFVKTPGLSPIKTRLAKEIGKDKAEAFHLSSAQQVCATLLSFSKSNISFFPFWAVAEEAGQDSAHWSSMPCLFQGNGELGHRLHHIYGQLLEKFDAGFLLGADSPEIDSSILESAIVSLEKHDFVMGPATDGGFYLFGGKQKLALSFWTSIPYSTADTANLLHHKVKGFGSIKLIDTLSDVDTFEDLQKLKNRLISIK